MERLTSRDEKGNLNVDGKEVYAGYLYNAVALLEEYEDTGLTTEQVQELKDRDTAKKPVQTEDGMVCPICGSKAVPWSRFCDECGHGWWEKED